jgi:hypothetical protein
MRGHGSSVGSAQDDHGSRSAGGARPEFEHAFEPGKQPTAQGEADRSAIAVAVGRPQPAAVVVDDQRTPIAAPDGRNTNVARASRGRVRQQTSKHGTQGTSRSEVAGHACDHVGASVAVVDDRLSHALGSRRDALEPIADTASRVESTISSARSRLSRS